MVYLDPYVSKYHEPGQVKKGEPNLTAELLASADLVSVTLAHPNDDYGLVPKQSKVIFGTKNAIKAVADRVNVELL